MLVEYLDGKIVDYIINTLWKKKREVYLHSNPQKEPEFIIYIDTATWHDMMTELKGEVTSLQYEVYQSQGKEIMGYKIYKVLSDERQIRIFEDK